MIRKILSVILIGTTLAMVSCGSGEAKEVKEQKIKIASGTVAATEVLDALELDLVGVPTTKSTLPERYNGVQDIGQAFSPNFETLVSLAPELVVFDNNFKEKLNGQLTEYGINPFYFNTSTFNNFKDSILELGKLTDREKKAEELSNKLQDSVDKVLEKSKKSNDKAKVAILFGTSESYMLATDLSYVGDLLNTIGIDNITDTIEKANSAYLNFSLEQVVQLNPDYILRLNHGDVEAAKKSFDKEFATNPAWKSLKAVKDGKVYDLDSNIFGVSANLRVTEAIEEIGNIIYGE